MEPITIMVNKVQMIAESAIELLPQLCISLFIILLTFALARLAKTITKRLLKTTHLRPSLVSLMVLLSSLGIWVFGY